MLMPGSGCQTRWDWRIPLSLAKLSIGVSFHGPELFLRGEPLATRSDWGSFVLRPPAARSLAWVPSFAARNTTLLSLSSPCLLARSFLA